MHRPLFFRNISSRDNLEIFLVSAISGLLLLRFYLSAAGYPTVGGTHLHIAHMLYGGLLMAAAIMLVLSFLGERVQRLAALIGGVGFGVFIDELGKFITRDNNYFFRPTIGIIYAVFIILYLAANFLSDRQHLSEQEYALNALAKFEQVVVDDLDRDERAEIRRLLEQSDQKSALVKALTDVLKTTHVVAPTKPGPLRKTINYAAKTYRKFWGQRGSSKLISAIFIVEALILLGAVVATVLNNFDNVSDLITGRSLSLYDDRLILGQLLATLISGAFVVAGALKLSTSRLQGFELFRKAVLINIFLTEFFIFSRIQFGAIPGFLVNLVLLIALHYSIHEERRLEKKA